MYAVRVKNGPGGDRVAIVCGNQPAVGQRVCLKKKKMEATNGSNLPEVGRYTVESVTAGQKVGKQKMNILLLEPVP